MAEATFRLGLNVALVDRSCHLETGDLVADSVPELS